ncbi:hypothetical protein ACIA8K_38930 [Catenuloplanes sp. NPDC051500]|uniref:hypothetical protein n=1 Tax=Catenuloplanes sp. NPDC051500 TaxID=3363959 RepID=UPI003791B539
MTWWTLVDDPGKFCGGVSTATLMLATRLVSGTQEFENAHRPRVVGAGHPVHEVRLIRQVEILADRGQSALVLGLQVHTVGGPQVEILADRERSARGFLSCGNRKTFDYRGALLPNADRFVRLSGQESQANTGRASGP